MSPETAANIEARVVAQNIVNAPKERQIRLSATYGEGSRASIRKKVRQNLAKALEVRAKARAKLPR
jgi:hypothetical protein